MEQLETSEEQKTDVEKVADIEEQKPGKGEKIRSFFFQNKSKGRLAAKSILFLVIPYLYLIIWGIIYDAFIQYLAGGFTINFIFFSMLALYIVAIWLIVVNVRVYKGKMEVPFGEKKEAKEKRPLFQKAKEKVQAVTEEPQPHVNEVPSFEGVEFLDDEQEEKE